MKDKLALVCFSLLVCYRSSSSFAALTSAVAAAVAFIIASLLARAASLAAFFAGFTGALNAAMCRAASLTDASPTCDAQGPPTSAGGSTFLTSPPPASGVCVIRGYAMP